MRKILLILISYLTLTIADTNIILVHGFTANSNSWKTFVNRLTNRKYMKVSLTLNTKKQIESIDWRYLKNSNYEILTEEEKKIYKNKRVFVIDFSNNNTLTFEEQGYELHGMINDISKITQINDFILIGHSMGGLAIRAYVQSYNNKNIKKIITLDTPHEGSGLANYLGVENNEKLEPNSDALTDLNNPIIKEEDGVLSKYKDIETFFLAYADNYCDENGGYYCTGDSVVEIESQLGSNLQSINPTRIIFSSDTNKNNMNYGNKDNHSFKANHVVKISNMFGTTAHNGMQTNSISINKTISLLPKVNYCIDFKKVPFLDNDGDINLHYWTKNIQLQNCINPNISYQPFSAVFKTNTGNYLIEKGFWTKYKENSFGVNNLGNPTSNEEVKGNDTCQAFDKGVLIWNKNTKIKTLIGDGITCNNYMTEYKSSNCFSDVNEYTNYSEKICKIKDNEIIGGYDDGNYKPNQLINRAEFTKMIVNSIDTYKKSNYSVENRNENLFDDVPIDAWFAEFIYYAKDDSIVKGKKDGKFHPADNINYAEASKIIVIGLIDKTTKEEDGDKWYQPFIKKLEEKGISFSPSHKLTRAEMAYIIYSVLKVKGL